MMLKQLRFVALLATFTFSLTACKEDKGAAGAASTTEPSETLSKSSPTAKRVGPAPTVDELKALHPDTLGEWTFKSAKTKNQDWGIEYSGTYQKDGDELKLVVNRANEDDPAAWVELFKTPEDFDGKPAFLDKRDTKETFMVRVGTKWRVDFKTKAPGSVDLQALAKTYNFSEVEKLAAK